MVWLLMNNLNYDRAKAEYLEDRAPFIEYIIKYNSYKTISGPYNTN